MIRVVVTGATGFIGRSLVPQLQARGDEVRVLARDPARAGKALPGTKTWAWDAEKAPPPAEALAGADVVVHLAGEGVADSRWTEERKKRIYDSRVVGTRNLVAAFAASPPKVLIAGSAIGIYGSNPGVPVDETAPHGSDFLARVCVDWEAEARPAEVLGVRVVYLRTGVVVGKGGGALSKMLTPFKLGVGGRIGSGRQHMSWIHLEDEVGMILWALDNPMVWGPLNAVAPQATTNGEFTRALGRALHRPAVFPVPSFALKVMLGSQLATEVLLSGQEVKPAAALAGGYRFRQPALEAALRAAVAV